MIQTIRTLFRFLDRSERIRGTLLLTLMTLMAALEVAGVASIMPLLVVLGDPTIIETNPYLNSAYVWVGMPDQTTFLALLAVASLLFLLGVCAFRSAVWYAQCVYCNMRRHRFASRLLRSYVNRPFSFFLCRHPSLLAKTVLSEVDEIIENGVTPALLIISHGMVVIFLAGLILFLDPLLGLLIASTTACLFALIYLFMRRLLAQMGDYRMEANAGRFQAATEVLSGVKELKVLGRERALVARFAEPSKRYSRCRALSEVMAEVPKYLVEVVGFSAILAVALYLVTKQGDIAAALPVIGIYAFAGYRLLPSLHKVYSSIALLRYAAPAVDAVAGDLRASAGGAEAASRGESLAGGRLRLCKAIEFEGVSFRYPDARSTAIRSLSVAIPAGGISGIVGPSGVGKSTVVDLLLGLLRPQAGRILIDGVALTEANERAWQNNIGYVPQQIFLADDTVARNIAFGIDPEAIDHRALERAARMAQLHDFIMAELPEGYATRIGERGARLSGGQRQRLGIARALYHDPDIVVFDEATNALDHETEAEVIAALEQLAGQKTIIMVTHRLTTLKHRAHIIRLENGRLAQPAECVVKPLVLERDQGKQHVEAIASSAGHAGRTFRLLP